MDVMLNWGGFLFEVPTTAYNQLTRSQGYRWGEHSPQGQPPVYHWGGVGEQQITLDCTLYTQLGATPATVDDLQRLADQGTPHLLVDGTGSIWGLYVLTELTHSYGEYMHPRGIPAKQTLQLTFLKYGG